VYAVIINASIWPAERLPACLKGEGCVRSMEEYQGNQPERVFVYAIMRPPKFLIYLCPALFVLSLSSSGQDDLPFRVNKVNDRVIIFSPGKYSPEAPTAVITTAQGLILIDTGLSPTLAGLTRRRIIQELARDDISYVINTHFHFDHTDGNQVYAGAVIIGHESDVPAIRQFAQGKDQFLASQQNRLQQLESRLKSQDPESPEALTTAETIRFQRILIDDLQKRYTPTPPTRTFSDRLDLTVADLAVQLYHFGPAHTNGDILIHIPALGILFIGDLFHPQYLSATADPANRIAVPRWIEILGLVLKNETEVKRVIGGHGHIMTRDWLAAQHQYIQDLWNAVLKVKKEGGDVRAVAAQYPLEKAFAYLSPHFDLRNKDILYSHEQNILNYWRSTMTSAAAEIDKTLRQSGPDAARARFKELLGRQAHEYYVDEREFNALGYRYLQQERKIPEATAVFEMNTEAFQQSWNVWDSLAEACMLAGNNDKAETYYARSIALNPGNTNGKNNLSRIQGRKLDVQGETREAAKFLPGANTGIRKPYLGQTPPGLEPRIFAPGIISTAGNLEFSIAFTPDGREAYFTRRKDPGGSNTMMVSRREKNGWTAPEEAAFSKGYPSNEPYITPDGKKFYFGCLRLRPGAARPEYGIWITERTPQGWSEPRYHGPGMFVSSSRIGNLYMTDVTNVAGGGIISYPFVNGSYGAPQKMAGGINTPGEAAHACIAPNESFIVFDSYNRPGGQGGEGDLWVCFHKADGSWSEGYNLGDKVNTPATNFCPALSPDGKFLFFSTCRDIYWVSTEVIHRLRPRSLK
jgi:glyoxylase-like metal-dependent hydrolase (beta-lactamase superfamily II)